MYFQALDLYWHEDCLKCGCCDCRLGEVGHSLSMNENLLLCKIDYLRWTIVFSLIKHIILNMSRLFGSTGYCAACNKVIPAFEMVMRARTNVYHLECFACQQCQHRWEICFSLSNKKYSLLSGSVLVINSICLIIRFSVVQIMRKEYCLQISKTTLTALLNLRHKPDFSLHHTPHRHTIHLPQDHHLFLNATPTPP